MIKMKKVYLCFTLLLTACVTMSGTYNVYAIDSEGQTINSRTRLISQGSAIYSSRNALCSVYPDAKIIIKDIDTGKELKGESGYQCH
jgi:hypothetical protein